MKLAIITLIMASLMIAGCTQSDSAVKTAGSADDTDLFGGMDMGLFDYTPPPNPNEGTTVVIEQNPGPGPYVGTAIGYYEYAGTVTVTLDVVDGKLTMVNVTGPLETAGIGSQAIDMMGDMMLKANSIKVDIISGATHSSEAVLLAAAKALGQAGLTDADLKR